MPTAEKRDAPDVPQRTPRRTPDAHRCRAVRLHERRCAATSRASAAAIEFRIGGRPPYVVSSQGCGPGSRWARGPTATGAWAGSTDVALTRPPGGGRPAPAGTAVPRAPAAHLSSGYRSMHYVTSVSGFRFRSRSPRTAIRLRVRRDRQRGQAVPDRRRWRELCARLRRWQRRRPSQFNGRSRSRWSATTYVADFSNNRIQRFNKVHGACRFPSSVSRAPARDSQQPPRAWSGTTRAMACCTWAKWATTAFRPSPPPAPTSFSSARRAVAMAS